ncbi:MAG: sensor histidine kinase, partial [Methanosarcinales archaeon]|nr:sensor histidine kinase [Methanosarcinales archaeon]
DSLLRKVCDVLIEARSYDTVWLGFSRDGETFDRVVGSGFAEDIDRFCESVMAGNHPPCIKKALARNDRIIVDDKSGECGDCFFASSCLGKESAIVRVEHADRLFGLLAISRVAGIAVDEDEKELLEEVASDIAFALHDMEMKEAHKRAEDRIKASLKEKEVLLREIHHRVKNNLQVVSSLLDMQARGARNKDTIDALTESQNRINAMALIHAQLYESGDLAEINMKGFVNKLLVQLFQSYPVKDTEITRTVSVADYPVPISMAVPVGLIVNELLSNALKHAFVGRKEGQIEVSLTASEEGKINLMVSDDGVGLPPGFDINETGTLGLRLIKILTEDQLHGTLEVISEDEATFNIEF